MKTKEEIQKIINSDLGYCGRMISGSKSFYCEQHPKHFAVFNANIIVPEYGKVWYGDIDLTKEAWKLITIAKEIETTIYVLREMDCRFDTENNPIDVLISKAVWNTTMEIKK